jgi:glycosyltransferase involved in cell wall biosynthesis
MPIGIIGTIKDAKGQAALLRRSGELFRRIPTLSLQFAGSGPQEPELKAWAHASGLGSRVVFHGQLDRPQLYRFIRSCRLVVVPSLWPEPFGRVPLEAALADRPVVAFAVGGLGESIEHDVTGKLAPAADFPALFDGIVALANDAALRTTLCASARARLAVDNDPAKIAKELFSVWRSEFSMQLTNMRP